MLQEGFTEGVVSVKEAAVYISKTENRYGSANDFEVAGECVSHQLFVSAEAFAPAFPYCDVLLLYLQP